ncbi:hypothetical protein [Actinomadura rugatobispora]|uniref:Uncharacterized protein n=1 Tax=Actinomadura rugatobispora TaxID=1994 RepID=A0ABW1A4X1_9ACTN|nr:hypothetical protein GCM10010200_083000 [Actinomadura rugatobispora]
MQAETQHSHWGGRGGAPLRRGVIVREQETCRHVVAALPEIVDWLALGVDYGTGNPFAAEMLGLGADGRLYLTHEWRYSSREPRCQLTDVECSARLRD